jgi:nucleoside-diphosphate-sugar epimerase
MKKILITGATGFIGSHCLPLLQERDFEVHAVSSRISEEERNGVYWHKVDLLDPRKSSDLIRMLRPTHLLHLAWSVSPGKYWTTLENIRWVQSSLEMLRSFMLCGGWRVVMAGTCAEYDWRYGCCSEKVTPFNPETLYGACKHALQIILNASAEQNGISAAWGRLFYIYGPREPLSRLVPSVILSLLKGEAALCSHGSQIRDILYVKDVADAFVTLVESDVSGPINIASGNPIRLKDVIYKIADKLNKRDLIQLGALSVPKDDPSLLVANVSRLTDELNWHPEYDLDRGLEETIDWWKNHLTKSW